MKGVLTRALTLINTIRHYSRDKSRQGGFGHELRGEDDGVPVVFLAQVQAMLLDRLLRGC